MSRVFFFRPIDQFSGKQRLLTEIQQCLRSDHYQHLRLAVAFAKSGPLLRLTPLLEEWKRQNKSAQAILGIDRLGTSKQALERALESFDNTFVTHVRTKSSLRVTFHPKFYLFYGDNHATCFYGSHNLTVGGTETNLEGGVKIEFERPTDEISFQEALSCWTSLLPDVCPMTLPLDLKLLNYLVQKGAVDDENNPKRDPSQEGESSLSQSSSSTEQISELFPVVNPHPPSAIPKNLFTASGQKVTSSRKEKGSGAEIKQTFISPVSAQALVIEIIPHDNNEVLLSMAAINQSPGFFDYPFTGRTVPKKPGTPEQPGNPSYPQRTPDPVVYTTKYNARGRQIMRKKHSLNMVLYERKKEVRITFPPDVLKNVQKYSIMVMRKVVGAYDYDIDIFNPGSQSYRDYLSICNQTLPAGGAKRARKMGWL